LTRKTSRSNLDFIVTRGRESRRIYITSMLSVFPNFIRGSEVNKAEIMLGLCHSNKKE